MSDIHSRKIYFASLFSVFILFGLLIIARTPFNLLVDERLLYLISTSAITPALLIFMKRKRMELKVVVGYIPGILGFIISILFNNSVYFLISFPIFLLSFIVIFPRGEDGKLP